MLVQTGAQNRTKLKVPNVFTQTGTTNPDGDSTVLLNIPPSVSNPARSHIHAFGEQTLTLSTEFPTHPTTSSAGRLNNQCLRCLLMLVVTCPDISFACH